MKIELNNKFLHITAIGTLILTLITGGVLGLAYAFIFGSCLGMMIRQAREKKNG